MRKRIIENWRLRTRNEIPDFISRYELHASRKNYRGNFFDFFPQNEDQALLGCVITLGGESGFIEHDLKTGEKRHRPAFEGYCLKCDYSVPFSILSEPFRPTARGTDERTVYLDISEHIKACVNTPVPRMTDRGVDWLNHIQESLINSEMEFIDPDYYKNHLPHLYNFNDKTFVENWKFELTRLSFAELCIGNKALEFGPVWKDKEGRTGIDSKNWWYVDFKPTRDVKTVYKKPEWLESPDHSLFPEDHPVFSDEPYFQLPNSFKSTKKATEKPAKQPAEQPAEQSADEKPYHLRLQ
jgi:hypothetical protein